MRRKAESWIVGLNDGTYKLFFNTAGHIGDIPSKLKELLAYMNNTKAYPVEQSDNDLSTESSRPSTQQN